MPDTGAEPVVTGDMIRVAMVEELQREGMLFVRRADRPIVVVAYGDKVSALDNRCPHLGFPLHRGTIKGGIITCHWQHVRRRDSLRT